MADRNGNLKMIYGGVLTVALGVSLFFLSRESASNQEADQNSGDSSDEEQVKAGCESVMRLTDRHTLEKLRELLDMMHIELTCNYVRVYNKMMQVRESQRAALDPSKVMEFEQKVREQIKSNQAEICKEYCLTCFPKLHKNGV